MSQQELATQVGVSRSTIAGYENNHISPSLDVICRLSEIFNVRVDAFIDYNMDVEITTDSSPLDYDLEYLINKFQADLLNKEVLYHEGRKLDQKETHMLITLIDNVKDLFTNLIPKG